MKKILVTGGTGFIGSHTTVVLLEQGYDVVIFDNLSNSKASVVDRIERIAGRRPGFVHGDIRDEAALAELFKGRDAGSDLMRSSGGSCPGGGGMRSGGAPYDAVIHFAGLKAVGESVEQPERYHETNVAGSLKLYEAMAAAGVKTLIFSSSATVYGADNAVPYTEDMALSATNPYGETKILNELKLREICESDPEWSAALLRYFNPGGAHPSGLIGEDPSDVPNNLLPYVARVASGELDRITIFGNDYGTPDGTGLRDYIHVMDVARGHVLALERLAAGASVCVGYTGNAGGMVSSGNGEVRGNETGVGAFTVNLGTGRGTSVREIIAAFEAACGKALPAVVGPRRAGDLPSVYADVTLARELLGFEAEHSIEDICADAWRWQQNAAGLG